MKHFPVVVAFALVTSAFAIRHAGLVACGNRSKVHASMIVCPLELGSRSTSAECDAVVETVKHLEEAFGCVKEYVSSCGGSGGGGGDTTKPPPVGTLPTPPATEETAPPPRPGDTTTTTKATTAGTTKPTVAPPPPSGEVEIGTYIPNWFVYRKFYMGVEKLGVYGNEPQNPDNAKGEYVFWAKDLESLAPKFNSLYYAFWNLDESCYVQDVDPDASWYGAKNDPTWIPTDKGQCKGLMNDMMALKSKFSHIKLLVSVGGWTYSKHFSNCASSQAGIEMFYKTFAFRANEMDKNWGKSNAIWNGIDFDWEFPESAAGLHPDHSDADWDNYVKLIEYFRSAAASEGRNKIVLSTAIGVGETLDKLIAKPATARAFVDSLDHVNLMTYDIHGKWDPTTGHNAPFCWDTRSGNPGMKKSISGVVNALLDIGCNAQKLILGIPNYAHAWARIPAGPLGNGLFSKATNPNQFVGWSTFSDSDKDLIPQGIITWWDLQDVMKKYSDFKKYSWDCPADNGIVVPIKHLYSETKQAFASIDDEEVVRLKAQWARSKGLGGFFFWDAQQDKHGELLDAARAGWGSLPTYSATGSYTCHDSSKPNYDMDPGTGAAVEKICQKTNHSIKLGGGDTCFALKEKATAECGGKNPTVIGGEHNSNAAKCELVCGKDWGAGDIGAWAGDVIYYICEGEALEEAGSGGGGGGGGGSTGSGKDCKTCGSCKAVPGYVCEYNYRPGFTLSICFSNSQGAGDDACAPCANGGQTWWPCNVNGLCQCA